MGRQRAARLLRIIRLIRLVKIVQPLYRLALGIAEARATPSFSLGILAPGGTR